MLESGVSDVDAATAGATTTAATLLDALGHGSWEWWPGREVWRLSATCAGLLGYPEEACELSGQGWLERAVADDRERLRACMTARADHDGQTWQCQFRVMRADGTEAWILLRATVVESATDGGAAYVVGTCSDISGVDHSAPEVRRREARLASALGNAQIAWFERDLATNIGIGSPSLATIYDLDNRTGPWHYDEIRSRILPEDLPTHVQEIAGALTARVHDQTTRRMQYRIRRADGAVRTIEVRYRNDFAQDDGHGVAFGLIFDVTETKALESKFQEAMRHAGVAWFERDLATDMMSGSDSLWQIYGFDPRNKPLLFEDMLARLHPDDRNSHPAGTAVLRARSLALNGKPESCDTIISTYRIVTVPGIERWVEVRYRVHLDGHGGGRVNGLALDVTATRVARDAAQDSETHLRLALEAVDMATWAWNFRTGKVTSNHALGAVFGVASSGPWRVEELRETVVPEDTVRVLAALRAAQHGGAERELNLEFRVRRADGEVRWLEIRGRSGRDGMHGIAVDITARKQEEIEHNRLYRQLQQAQKMESIGLLTGGIAHDFNNILASILGYSGLALQRFGNSMPDKLADYIKEVQIAGGRARDLVEQMLSFSRGEAGELIATTLEPVLEQTLKMLRSTLPSTIEITTAFEHGLSPVMADPVQLQQVVLNLCINARDATGGSGNIALQLSRRRVVQGHCASCHADFAGEFVVLSVADDGPGIAEALQMRIFEPFFSTKTSGRGTGMGLSIVHGIVHRHDGHVELASGPGRGCCFEVLLPVVATLSRSSQGGDSIDIASYEAARPAQVLVVDDERAVASFVGELLEISGYSVTVETDATRAWETFAQAPDGFDIVVTDQTMPRLTGAQLAARMLGVRPDLPVVLMTGYSATVDEHKALELGMRAYLRKPVKGDDLLAAVASALEHAARAS